MDPDLLLGVHMIRSELMGTDKKSLLYYAKSWLPRVAYLLNGEALHRTCSAVTACSPDNSK